MLMGSELHGVPVSAAEAAPPTSPKLLSSASFPGIRAPLTIDDSDFEYSVSGDDNKDGAFSSNESDTGLESDGFLSGEDGSETAGPDDEILEETHFVKEYVVSKPVVRIPSFEIHKRSSFDRNFEGSRPFKPHSDGRVAEESVVGEEYNHPSPRTSVEVSENATLVRVPSVNTGSSSMHRPIALLSRDSDDDDFVSDGSVEDEPFLGVARVSSFGGAGKVGSAPKVRILEVGDDSTSESDSGSEGESLEDTVLVRGESGDDGFSNSCLQEKQITDDLIGAEVIEDKGPFIVEEARSGESCDEIQEFKLITRENGVEHGDDEMNSGTVDFTDEETKMLNDPNGVKEAEQQVLCSGEVENTEAKARSAESCDELQEVDIIARDDGVEHRVDEKNSDTNGFTDEESKILNDRNGVKEVEQVLCSGEVEVTSKARNAESCDEIQEFDTIAREDGVDLRDDQKNSDSVDFTDVDTTMLNDPNGVKEVEQVLCCGAIEVTEAKVRGYLEEASMNYGNCGDKNESGSGTVSQPCEVDAGEDLKSVIERKTDQTLETHETDAPKCLESIDSVGENEIQFMNNIKFSDSQVFKEPGCFLSGRSINVSHVTSGESSEIDLPAIDAKIVADSGNLLDAHSHSEREEVSSSFTLEEPLRVATGDKSESSKIGPLKQLDVIDSKIPASSPTAQQNRAIFTEGPISSEPFGILTQEEKMEHEKLQEIVVKFLRLVHRLQKTPEDSVCVEVLHQLLVAAQRPFAESFNFDSAKQKALVLEAEGKNDFNFSLNVLVIGKSGVGKSATINSIFGEEKARINAFELGTTRVKEIRGTSDGIQIRVLDTPGFSSSLAEQSFNCKVLSSIKKFTKKFPPDVVLYVDRLDTQIGDLNDLPLLKLITSCLGSSTWSRTIVTLTHAASFPPEGPSGDPLSYDLFVAKTSHHFQQLIRHSVGDFGITEAGPIPVSLIENCSGIENNEQKFLCSKESWRSQLLLLCSSMKILSEIDSVVKSKRTADHQKLFGFCGNHSSESASLFRATPVVYLHSCDHDCGCDGLSIKGNLAIAGYFPAGIAAQMRRNKNDGLSINLNSAVSAEHGDKGLTMVGHDIETAGMQLVYILKMETQLRNFKVNKTAARVTITLLGENAIAELKVEDQLLLAKDLVLLGSTGIIQYENDTAYEATLGIRLSEKCDPTDQRGTLLGISLTRWRGDLSCGLNLQSLSVRPDSKLSIRAGLNGKRKGMVSVRLSSSDQPLIAALAFLPIARTLCRTVFMLLSQRRQEQ